MNKQVGPDAAIAELPRKLRHENAMQRKLKSLFNDIAEELRIDIELIGRPSNLSSFTREMDVLVTQTYRKTSKTFKSEIRKHLELGNINGAQIDIDLDNFILVNAEKQSRFIMDTTQKEALKITNRIIEENAKEGIALTNEQLSTKVASDFKKRNRIRSKTIAQTEVQNISEQSKFTEAQVLESNNVITTMKRWDAVLDRRTRNFHAVADGQRRRLDEPFKVGGELLMRPGDSSLGASPKNLINCRCSIQFINLKV